MTARELGVFLVEAILWIAAAAVIVSIVRDRIRHAREWRKFTHKDLSR